MKKFLFFSTLFFFLVLILQCWLLAGGGIGLVCGQVAPTVTIEHSFLEMGYTTALQKVSK
jgi:hypothetical protein